MAVPAHLDQAIPKRLDQLDDYLLASESKFDSLRDDCEKKIVWYNDHPRQRDLSMVYIHGFSASRMETWPLCDRLADALGANVFYTRLTGHGQDSDAMGTASVTDWLNDGMEAITIGARLGHKIILMGTSTGGTLATWLAAQSSVAPLIHSLILLSPNFYPKNPMAAAAIWPPALRLFERFFGSWRSFSATGPKHEQYWTVRYPLKAIAVMMKLVHLSWRTDLISAAMPVLMIINPWDRVINVSLAIARFSSFPSPHKKLVLFRGNKDFGRHLLAGDLMAPESTAKTMAIIKRFLNYRS